MKKYRVIGLMSGTSLDGVDIAYCEFRLKKKWSFELLNSETIPYDKKWKKCLGDLHKTSSEKISEVDFTYGEYLGRIVNTFCKKHKLDPDFVSSHGHTIFHQPEKNFTRQIGSGASLSANTGLQVVCDFRSLDVARGGQGAPLVPVGDRHLFSQYKYRLNLGGIANVSFEHQKETIAFDVCPCNLILNYYSQKAGLPYDKDGKLAKAGKVNGTLLKKLNAIKYYSKTSPKSLGREDVEEEFIPLIEKSKLSAEDCLHTFCEHAAMQLSKIFAGKKDEKVLITGGGAYHKHLIEKISSKTKMQLIIPEKEIIEFKEAIIFAFLGVLRVRNEINCLKSVTGASSDSCGGAVYTGIKLIF